MVQKYHGVTLFFLVGQDPNSTVHVSLSHNSQIRYKGGVHYLFLGKSVFILPAISGLK